MPGLPALSNPKDPSETGRSAEATFKLGRYNIVSRIASGGMATVYRGRLESEGGFARDFAIKVIHPHLAAAEGFRERFLDEARVASRVRHANVVATVDSDRDQGYHFLVLNLVDGLTLRQMQVAGLTRLPPGEAARVVCDAARGLHAVHSVCDDDGETLGVVHRDISPHNLMLDSEGNCVLIDLGLAKARGQMGHTQTGVLCGKLPYMSPEQSRIDPLDARSDVFSLGSVLFELALGVPPFGDDHTPSTLDNLRICDPERLATMMAQVELPSWLCQVVLRCLRPEPDDRYASAAALAHELDEGMRRAGIIQSTVRRELATRVATLQSKLRPEQSAEPLPVLIGAEDTSPHPQVAAPRAWLRRWAGGLGMAAAGGLTAITVIVALGRPWDRPTSPDPLQPREQGTVEATPEATELPEPAPVDTRDALGVDTFAVPSDDPSLAPSAPGEATTTREPRRPHRGGRNNKLDGFKSNPY